MEINKANLPRRDAQSPKISKDEKMFIEWFAECCKDTAEKQHTLELNKEKGDQKAGNEDESTQEEEYIIFNQQKYQMKNDKF